MDNLVFFWFNQFNGKSDAIDLLVQTLQISYFKSVPFMLTVWALWFVPQSKAERTIIRERLAAALISTLPIIVITRAAANYLPFRYRPLHTPGLEINLSEGQDISILDGWSSMPSDHASLFVGLAVAILLIHRSSGLFLLAWAIFVVSLPRIILGFHWPSDILVGAIIGAFVVLVLLKPLTRLVAKSGIIPFLEAREALLYPMLFLVTYEISQMFRLTRYIVEKVL